MCPARVPPAATNSCWPLCNDSFTSDDSHVISVQPVTVKHCLDGSDSFFIFSSPPTLNAPHLLWPGLGCRFSGECGEVVESFKSVFHSFDLQKETKGNKSQISGFSKKNI